MRQKMITACFAFRELTTTSVLRPRSSTILADILNPSDEWFPALRITFEFLKTLFLFTKSDIKTIVIPVTFFAISIAPLRDSAALAHLVFWIWLHVLQCALANQLVGVEEDAINKPDRPIPSGRVTVDQAKVLRWINLLICFAFSACYSLLVLKSSISLAALLYIYNDLGFNFHWASRNLLNGAGLVCFEVGATLIAGRDRCELCNTSVLAIGISAAIFVTTIHTQDFKDQFGDRHIGRLTLPMIFPMASRATVLFSLITWSIFLAYLWNVTPSVMLVLGTVVGVRFMLLRSVADDQQSFFLYTVWLSVANVSPALANRSRL